MSARSGNPVDALVPDCFFKATEAILQDRRAHLRPITSQAINESNDYVRHVLNTWKQNITTSLTLDIYIHIPKSNEHLLLERWSFSYMLSNDLKDTRPFAIINRRVQTLLRSLYCFVRMLPGFNMLPQCAIKPLLSFQLYSEQRTMPSQFKHEVSKYQFPKISTSKGLISIAVIFLNSTPVKAIVKSISSTSVPSNNSSSSTPSAATTPQAIRRDSATVTVPIPITSPSSYDGGGMMRNRSVSSDARDMHRRTFQLPTDNQSFSRSFEIKNNIMDASPFRPNDGSHLYGAQAVNNRSSPLSGTSPGMFTTASIPIPAQNTRSSGNTPVGSYSTPPFAFQGMMEERNSDASSKDLLPTGSSPVFPHYSSSLTSTSPHIMGQFLNTALSEKRLSFGRNKATNPLPASDSIAATGVSGFSIPGNGSVSSDARSTALTVAPSQLMLPEWQFLRQKLNLPIMPIRQISSEHYQSETTQSDKEKKRELLDFRTTGDLMIADGPTRSSSGATKDDFFDKLKDDARCSFFGEDDDDLPFAVHQSEQSSFLPQRLMNSETPKEIEVILMESFNHLQHFRQFSLNKEELTNHS